MCRSRGWCFKTGGCLRLLLLREEPGGASVGFLGALFAYAPYPSVFVSFAVREAR